MPVDLENPEDLQDSIEASDQGDDTGAAPSALRLPTTSGSAPLAPPTTGSVAPQGRRLPGYQPGAPLDPNAQPFFVGSAPPAQAQSKSTFKDFARQVYGSTLEMGQGVVGAASAAERALNMNPDIIAHTEQTRRAVGDLIAQNLQAMSPEAQKAAHSSLFGGKDDSGGDIPTPGEVGWGSYLGATAASFIPSAILAVVPPAILGPAGLAITGAAFGATQAGDAYNKIVDQVDKAKPEDLMQSPVYAEARKQGMDDINARRQIISSIAPPLVAMQFAVGAAAGAGTGGILTKGALGAAGSSLARRAGIGAAEGAATMGGQAAAGNALDQSASMQAGLQKEFDPSETARALATGGVGGALVGSVGGALHRGETPRATPEGVTDDQHAALNEALQLTWQPDRTQGPATPWTSTGEGMIPGQGGFTTSPSRPAEPTVPELPSDIKAQVAALADPDNPKDSVFVPKGTPMPQDIPDGVTRVIRPEGTLLTNNQAKAALFRRPGELNDTILAHVLNYPETKDQAAASGAPRVIQGKDADGNVVYEAAVSPQGEDAARTAAAAQVLPHGSVEATTPDAAVMRRLPPPPERPALTFNPDRSQGEGFTTTPSGGGEPAKPSGGMNRGNLVDALTKQGQSRTELNRMKIGDLRDRYDELNTPAAPTPREFRPEAPAEAPVQPILGDRPVDNAQAGQPTAAQVEGPAAAQAEPKPTVDAQLRKRAAEKARMAAEPQSVERGQPYVSPETETAVAAMPALLTRETAQKLTPRRVSPMAREARAEAESQPVVHERAKTTTVVEDAGAEKPRSAQTTNKERILSDLESKVSNGLMTAAEADRAYGRKEPGIKAGRQRKFSDFAAYIKDRLQRASDPDVERELLSRAEQIQNDKNLTTAQKLAQSREINRALQSVGPEYAEKLRGILNELKGGPSGLANPKGLGNRVDTFYDPRLNKPVWDALYDTHEKNSSASVHKYLDTIINDPVIKVRLPHAVALARALKERLPESLHVMSQEVAADRYGTPHEPQTLGMYYYKQPGLDKPFITLNVDHASGSIVETVLHESMHAVTTDYIRDLRPGSRDHWILDLMAKELRDNIGQRDYLTDDERGAINYAAGDPFELHTMLMTSPVIQRLAAEVKPSPEFQQAMRVLGYDLKPSTSIWQSFTQWVRKVIGLPAGVTSLLDHVMRPLQDITDRAVKFNRDGISQDSGLRAVAEPTLDAAAHALPRFDRDDVSRVIKRVDPAGLGDRARRALLGWATTDGIVEWNRKLFQSRDREAPGNPLEDYRTATEAQAARSKTFSDQYADRVKSMINSLRGPEYDTLSKLMNDATLAEAHLGTNDPNANAHLKTREQQQALSDLQARYDALSGTGKDTYNKIRDYYKQTYAEERIAQFKSMVKTALPDATSTQVRTLAQALRTKAGIKQLIDNPDASPVAAAFADAWSRNRALVKMVAKVHAQGFVSGDYFPLRRFGDYVVRYGTKGTGDYGVEMFERRSDAEARRAELVRQGAEPSQVLSKRDSNMRSMLPTTVVDELDAAVRHTLGGDEADSVRDAFASILLQHASRSEAARTRLRRQGVQGASLDTTRVLAQDFLSLSSRLGYLEHGADRTQALAAMRRQSDWLGRNGEAGEQIRAQSVLNELEQRQPAGDDSSGNFTGLTRKFSTLGFVYSLMSPSHMLTSTIEAHMNSTALLGARHGLRANLALAKALKDITPTMVANAVGKTGKAIPFLGPGLKAADWNLANVVRDRLISAGADRGAMMDLFKRLIDAGLIDHSMAREMQRIAKPGVRMGWWDRFMDLNAVGAHAVDVANKSAIAKAAYDLELRKTGNHEQAVQYAVDTARKAMPNYNVGNKSRISTNKGILGGAAAPLTQFKQYGLHMYSVMANLVRASIHGASRAERMEARKAFAGILATHAMMAGALTLVGDPLRYVGGAYDLITGATKPHDYENDVRRWIADAFGPELGEIISRGVPHAAGIDIHRRVGLSNLLEVPELKSFDKKGFAELAAAAMTGAAGDDASAMATGMSQIFQGNIMAGVKAMVPRVVRDPMKAYGLANSGVTDTKGRTILPASKLSGGDVAAQALGFQPARVSEFREGRNAVLEARDEATVDRTRALNAFVTASPSGRTSALKQVQDYNRSNPTSPITYAQLMSALKRQQQQVQTPGSFGLTLSKKSAQTLSKQGSFINQ